MYNIYIWFLKHRDFFVCLWSWREDSISLGKPQGGLQGRRLLRTPGLSWAAPAAPTSGASPGLCFAMSEPSICAFPACVAEARLFRRASELFAREAPGRMCSVTRCLSYCYFISHFPFILEWTGPTARRKKYRFNLQSVSRMSNICWGGDGNGLCRTKPEERWAARGGLRPMHPLCLLQWQHQTCFQKTSKKMGRGAVRWDGRANTTSVVRTSWVARIPPATTPALPRSVRGKGRASSCSQFQYFEVFFPGF